MNKQKILCERLKRQGFVNPLKDSRDTEAYEQLFRLLQPVAPVFNSRPGSPPKLVHRTDFNDSMVSANLREQHRLVKGRFQGGRIGYVLEEDLSLYGTVFRKPMQKTSLFHEEVISMIQNSGGISKDQLKEDLPFKAKDVMAALKRMQEAFLVYESQVDTDWNTGWFDFKTEWPGIELHDDPAEAVSEMLLRFLDAVVFATLDQVRSWSELRLKTIQHSLDSLMERGEIIRTEINGLGEGYMQTNDLYLSDEEIKPSIFVLDKSDFLVRVYLNQLKSMFSERKVLQYILIDGEFKGAVIGHWRIGPHDVEDIELCLEQEEAEMRKQEIIAAVRDIYSRETTSILKFKGEPLLDVERRL
ncbi:DNA glycosylase AlkZ-like family protein [Sporosarcina sp. Te-1]|uniref:DNA glycosylase AlkZ-like family protein n=1 Tax=Sporosarcina sp. Te-1 TaxID=2818390 RepID=UPI001A9FF93F|nr:crosslink repair DNA glycosylase YcaQ family protein [Sporosarcina sp. Te-1]QTD41819.1 winged helix DNA-binding domain-containing protein [Sporosarcina sp. Te-1]